MKCVDCKKKNGTVSLDDEVRCKDCKQTKWPNKDCIVTGGENNTNKFPEPHVADKCPNTDYIEIEP